MYESISKKRNCHAFQKSITDIILVIKIKMLLLYFLVDFQLIDILDKLLLIINNSCKFAGNFQVCRAL